MKYLTSSRIALFIMILITALLIGTSCTRNGYGCKGRSKSMTGY